jgi:predicted unusual protein kinase regulating ubiquinone biosynthesis (AarF/ABC1/UbiB family)
VLGLLRNENLLFTKIFQSLANSSSLELSPELRTEFRRFTANCPYTQEEIDVETLAEVSERYGIQFPSTTPQQSGMIALIFKGTQIDTGDSVILKLKRRNINARLSEACDSIRLLYAEASRLLPKHKVLLILQPFIDNLHDILDQCDFNREIRNLQQASEDYAELTCVRIPEVLGPTECPEGTNIPEGNNIPPPKAPSIF